MCCRTSVYPLDPALAAAVLQIGHFEPTVLHSEELGIAPTWQRVIPEEGTTVTASLAGGTFEISISPSISTFDHHLGKRVTASVYFEICAKYAEKVGGEIVQKATVVGCKDSAQGSGLLVARYPSLPMSFDRVCHGFQAVLLGGHDSHDIELSA